MPDADRPLSYDFAALAPRADFWSVRYVEEASEIAHRAQRRRAAAFVRRSTAA